MTSLRGLNLTLHQCIYTNFLAQKPITQPSIPQDNRRCLSRYDYKVAKCCLVKTPSAKNSGRHFSRDKGGRFESNGISFCAELKLSRGSQQDALQAALGPPAVFSDCMKRN